MRRLLALPTLVLLVGLARPAAALGHASVVTSTPSDGATVSTPPATVTITFDEDLGAASHFEVVDPAGATVGQGALASNRKVMSGTVTASGAGTYQVKWTAASADGDIARGVIAFTVSPAGSAGASVPVSLAPSTNAIPATASASAGSGSSTQATDAGASVLAPILVVLGVVVVGLGLLLRRRSPASPPT